MPRRQTRLEKRATGQRARVDAARTARDRARATFKSAQESEAQASRTVQAAARELDAAETAVNEATAAVEAQSERIARSEGELVSLRANAAGARTRADEAAARERPRLEQARAAVRRAERTLSGKRDQLAGARQAASEARRPAEAAASAARAAEQRRMDAIAARTDLERSVETQGGEVARLRGEASDLYARAEEARTRKVGVFRRILQKLRILRSPARVALRLTQEGDQRAADADGAEEKLNGERRLLRSAAAEVDQAETAVSQRTAAARRARTALAALEADVEARAGDVEAAERTLANDRGRAQPDESVGQLERAAGRIEAAVAEITKSLPRDRAALPRLREAVPAARKALTRARGADRRARTELDGLRRATRVAAAEVDTADGALGDEQALLDRLERRAPRTVEDARRESVEDQHQLRLLTELDGDEARTSVARNRAAVKRFRMAGFIEPKPGEPSEDAMAAAPEDGIFAIADGVSNSEFPGEFSRALVRGYTESRPTTAEEFREVLEEAQAEWDAETAPRIEAARKNYYARNTVWRASATFVGARLEGTGTKRRLNVAAIGDSNLFVVRGGKLVKAWPLARAKQFTSKTRGLSSTEPLKSPLETTTIPVKAGDEVFMVTDAVGAWVLTEVEAGREPFSLLRGIKSRGEMTKFVERARDQRLDDRSRMNEDDSTLLRFVVPGASGD